MTESLGVLLSVPDTLYSTNLLNKHVHCFNSLEMATGLDNLNGSHLINHDDLQGLSSHCQGEFVSSLYLLIIIHI